MRRQPVFIALLFSFLGCCGTLAAASRVKDVAGFEGVRDNQLVGYGLVVGLNGTGDRSQTFFSTQTLANMLGIPCWEGARRLGGVPGQALYAEVQGSGQGRGL